MRFLLVHSPFLGPAVWRPLEALLFAQGHEVFVPDLRAGLDAGHDAYDAMAALAAGSESKGALVVLHSGAGALAPSIWSANRRLDRVIFLDALLPHPGLSWLETLPPALAETLCGAARDGVLTPWPTWLPAGLFEQLVPDDELRTLISDEAPNTPVSFISQKAPDIPEWSGLVRGGYVRLSDAYDSEAKAAVAMGFWVEQLSGNHLSFVSDPSLVAKLLIAMAGSGLASSAAASSCPPDTL